MQQDGALDLPTMHCMECFDGKYSIQPLHRVHQSIKLFAHPVWSVEFATLYTLPDKPFIFYRPFSTFYLYIIFLYRLTYNRHRYMLVYLKTQIKVTTLFCHKYYTTLSQNIITSNNGKMFSMVLFYDTFE